MRLILTSFIVLAVALEVTARWLGRGPSRSRVAPGRHLLVYDDDCGLCLLAALGLQLRADDLALVGFSELAREGVLESLDQDALVASAHYITPEGVEYHGGEAVTRVLRLVSGGRLLAILDWPVIRGLRELGYRFVAWQRPRLSRFLRSWAG
jgi:predicted DCC family thiol-disulfide oxidoreductase YuxK